MWLSLVILGNQNISQLGYKSEYTLFKIYNHHISQMVYIIEYILNSL